MTLITRFRFEKLYRRHNRRLFGLAWRMCGFNTADAEDIVQETFCRALNVFHSYSEQNREYAWLKTICVNIVCERWRKMQFFNDHIRLHASSLCLSGVSPDPEKVAAETEALERVFNALRRVSVDFRDALLMKHVAGMSDEEIAGIQSSTVATVRSRIRRARKELAEMLAEGDTA